MAKFEVLDSGWKTNDQFYLFIDNPSCDLMLRNFDLTKGENSNGSMLTIHLTKAETASMPNPLKLLFRFELNEGERPLKYELFDRKG